MRSAKAKAAAALKESAVVDGDDAAVDSTSSSSETEEKTPKKGTKRRASSTRRVEARATKRPSRGRGKTEDSKEGTPGPKSDTRRTPKSDTPGPKSDTPGPKSDTPGPKSDTRRTPKVQKGKKKADVSEDYSSGEDKENEFDDDDESEEEIDELDEEEDEEDDDEGAELAPVEVPHDPKRAACGMPNCDFQGLASDFIAHYKKQHKGFRVAKCPQCKEKFKMIAPLVCHVYKDCYIKEEEEAADSEQGEA